MIVTCTVIIGLAFLAELDLLMSVNYHYTVYMCSYNGLSIDDTPDARIFYFLLKRKHTSN